jgi:hypothetical protein
MFDHCFGSQYADRNAIDGEYNDFYLDEGEIYNDFRRDWDADT